MNLFIIKSLVLLILVFASACSKYNIPVQTQNHPASPEGITFEIELSPLLDIDD